MKKAMFFIDFENLKLSIRPKRLDFDVLISAVQEKIKKDSGCDCRVFGNCYYEYEQKGEPKLGLMHEAHKRGLIPVYTPCYRAGDDASKSLCDPMLIGDALEALYKNPSIDVFVIVTSDKDFIPLIRKIAENGKEAIVIGVTKYGRFLSEECKRFGFSFLDYRQSENSLEIK